MNTERCQGCGQMGVECSEDGRPCCPDCNHSRIAELEAGAAVMRQTLETLNRLGGLGYEKHRWIEEALAPAAGRSLLDRLATCKEQLAGFVAQSEVEHRIGEIEANRARFKALEEAMILGNQFWEKWAIDKAEPAAQAAVAEYQNAIRALKRNT